MTVKQQINHGTIQRVCRLLNGIFHPIHLGHTFTFNVLSTKNNKPWNEGKEDVLYTV